MSLSISTDKVAFVLLADGWHRVENSSFDLDTYEYVDEYYHRLSSDVSPATGFTFIERLGNYPDLSGPRVRVSGPITSILAVREEM